MLNRDFFRILIKIIGLYFFIEVIFIVIPSQISFVGFDSEFSGKIGTIIYIFITVLLSVAILYFLIKFPDKIINLFQLDKGFDNDQISITNFNAYNILTISLVVIGGFLIIENVTTLISLLYQEFKYSNNPMFPRNENSSLNIILTALNIILGSILIIYRKNISAHFEK